VEEGERGKGAVASYVALTVAASQLAPKAINNDTLCILMWPTEQKLELWLWLGLGLCWERQTENVEERERERKYLCTSDGKLTAK